MKIVQTIGLFFSLLAVSYYLSFADRLNSADESGSITLGIGLIIVYLMAFISALLLIPSSFILWRKKARDALKFNGTFWHSLLVMNSILAIAYSAFALWLIALIVILLVQLS